MKTRRQQKHDMLIAFMANMNTEKKRRPVSTKPKLLRTLLSFFI